MQSELHRAHQSMAFEDRCEGGEVVHVPGGNREILVRADETLAPGQRGDPPGDTGRAIDQPHILPENRAQLVRQ